MRMTVVLEAQGIPSGNLLPLPRLTESPTARKEANALAEKVREGTGEQLSCIVAYIFVTQDL